MERNGSASLAPPWERTSHHFWEFYLAGCVSLKAVSGSHAWNRIVPLRTRTPFRISNWNSGIVNLEDFPHPVAFIANFRCTSSYTVQQAVDLCYAIRNTDRFQVQGPAGLQSLSLPELAQAAVSFLAQTATGQGDAGDLEVPFTLFSLISAEAESRILKIVNRSRTHRALEALVNWPPNPTKASLPKLEDAIVPTRGGPDREARIVGNRASLQRASP
jgi:hypothetical protein